MQWAVLLPSPPWGRGALRDRAAPAALLRHQHRVLLSGTRFGAGSALHTKRLSIVFCPFEAFISQLRAALSLRSRAEVERSGTSLDLSERANNNRNKVLRERNGQQNRSQASWRGWLQAQNRRIQSSSNAPFQAANRTLGDEYVGAEIEHGAWWHKLAKLRGHDAG
jgi:hypothetical protein